MIKLKNILAEGFAWERKEGKGLPTLAEVQAEYDSKQLKENAGDIFDEIADELGISSESFDDALNSSSAELDIIEKIYMSDSYTRTEALNMIADMLDIDINESNDDVYLAANEAQEAKGEDGRTETISAKRATAELKQKLAGKRSDGMGAYTSTIYGVDASGKKVKLTSLNDITKFKTFGITEKEPRWQDNDGDGKWYEPGVDVKENVNESFIGRLKKNLLGGAVRK